MIDGYTISQSCTRHTNFALANIIIICIHISRSQNRNSTMASEYSTLLIFISFYQLGISHHSMINCVSTKSLFSTIGISRHSTINCVSTKSLFSTLEYHHICWFNCVSTKVSFPHWNFITLMINCVSTSLFPHLEFHHVYWLFCFHKVYFHIWNFTTFLVCQCFTTFGFS